MEAWCEWLEEQEKSVSDNAAPEAGPRAEDGGTRSREHFGKSENFYATTLRILLIVLGK
jgi:hypothetical protein